MADSYGLALQNAVISTLRADTDLQALVGQRVFASLTEGQPHPLAVVGGKIPRPLRTDGKAAATVRFSIEGHARPSDAGTSLGPSAVVDKIGEAVVAALDEQTIAVSGFDLVHLQWISGPESAPEADGKTYQSITIFEALLDG
ncbi:MAG: DUF3168 domain-containing protein [Pseudomonadota bacterium]